MRNQLLRLILVQRNNQSQNSIFQVIKQRHLHSFTSARAPSVTQRALYCNHLFTSSTDEPAESKVGSVDGPSSLINIFSDLGKSDEKIKLDLETNGVVITRDLVLDVFKSREIAPDVARRLFGWVSENQSEHLSKKSYNLMLGILGSNGFVSEFWDMVEIMNKKGYGVSKGAYMRAFKRFEKDGLVADVEILKGLKLGSVDVPSPLINIFSDVAKSDEEIKLDLESNDVVITHDLVVSVLKNREIAPDVARRVFDWVSKNQIEKLSSKSYSWMIGMLGGNGLVNEFWDMVEIMNKKGYHISLGAYNRAFERFEKDGLGADVKRLEVLKLGSVNGVGSLINIFSDVVKSDEEIKIDLESNDVVITHDLVVSVLKNREIAPDVARRVFDWVSKNQSEKLSEKSYNWMLGILGGDGLVSEFWDMVEKMNKKGYGVSKGAYNRAFERFEKDGLGADLERLKVLQLGSVDGLAKMINIFSDPGKSDEEIKLDLESNGVVITHYLFMTVLRNRQIAPDVARRVFDWVSENRSENLNSKSYNAMLGVLGGNGFVREFWDMVEIMNKKGYTVSKFAYDRVFERFNNDGLGADVDRLKVLYDSGSISRKNIDVSDVERVCNIVRKEVWGADVEKRLLDLNVDFSSDVVEIVLNRLAMEPNKALIFFRWVEESDLFNHDEKSFSALARVLSREDHSEKFWRVVREMRNREFELEKEAYINVLQGFVKRGMIMDAVELYEFAMNGQIKPSISDCAFLLKKIVTSEELDLILFAKVVEVFMQNGNVLTDAHLDAVLKSLTSVGRISECNRILALMKRTGYVPSHSALCKVAYKLASGKRSAEAEEFFDKMEASRTNLDSSAWVSLIKGYCESRDLVEATNSLREMVDKKGTNHAGYALNMLVDTYCRKNRPFYAYKLVSEMVNEKALSPWNSTFKILTNKLLQRKCLKEAIDVMSMMKNQGLPPDLDSFVSYLSKRGSAEEAVAFTNAMTSKRFPSKSVYLRLFDAYLDAGRKSEAQDFLSKCPRYIRNNADVLDLFFSGKSRDRSHAEAVVPV